MEARSGLFNDMLGCQNDPADLYRSHLVRARDVAELLDRSAATVVTGHFHLCVEIRTSGELFTTLTEVCSSVMQRARPFLPAIRKTIWSLLSNYGPRRTVAIYF